MTLNNLEKNGQIIIDDVTYYTQNQVINLIGVNQSNFYKIKELFICIIFNGITLYEAKGVDKYVDYKKMKKEFKEIRIASELKKIIDNEND